MTIFVSSLEKLKKKRKRKEKSFDWRVLIWLSTMASRGGQLLVAEER